MVRVLVTIAVAIIMVSVTPRPAVSQDAVAEVETWSGGSVRITHPSLEVLYSIIPPRPAGGAAGAASAASSTAASAGGSMGSTVGDTSWVGGAAKAPQPIQGRDRRDSLTFVRGGVETRVPFDRIASLVVDRRAVRSSALPPYVTPAHAEYSARAILTDGSAIEAPSINFGATILRGIGPQGTIELPLDEVKTLKITR
jgi:hypothetical protein